MATITSPITITDVGRNMLRDTLRGASDPKIKYVALGTSNTPPSATDFRLGNEVFRKAVTSYTPANTGQIVITLYLAPNDAIGTNIAEIGFFGGSSASVSPNTGILVARGLYSHLKLDTESIQIVLDFSLL